MYKLMPDKVYIQMIYRRKFGRSIDWKNPQSFNEKLNWLKVYDRKPVYTTMVDKWEAKKYVSGIIGEEFIIPSYGVYDRFEDIDVVSLPNQFVIKCTHDSGSVVICRDKATFDWNAAKEKIERGLRRNLFWNGREWPYKNVKPRILVEKYMEEDGDQPLTDYKFLCFNGEPKLIEIHKGRYSSHHTQDFYDTDWKLTEIRQPSDPLSGIQHPKPVHFEEMLELSRALSKGIPQIRVDWYEIKGHLYFGELTFYDGGAFGPFASYEQDLLLGSWMDLSGIRT